MTGKLLVALAIVTLSASAASAAHHRHHHAVNANAATSASPPPMGWMGGTNSGDHGMYLQNLHDSGYNPKNDRDANGNVAAQ
ncbi:hypothetical protein [Bradyrhizobium sp. WSM1743]|uniref:hypothetical protein n=1 Tax=Bradyrhizobium sp. WSM1743 TaxID=318996 RepID=UPI0012EC3924|nr:hypothetical protein [Bradyrhizobium sp. WSM1743]